MDSGELFLLSSYCYICSKIRGQRKVGSPMEGPWSFYHRLDRHGHVCPIGPLPDMQPGLPGKILFRLFTWGYLRLISHHRGLK